MGGLSGHPGTEGGSQDSMCSVYMDTTVTMGDGHAWEGKAASITVACVVNEAARHRLHQASSSLPGGTAPTGIGSAGPEQQTGAVRCGFSA